MFGGLFEPKVVKPMVKTLKELQDVLGEFQDRAVQSELLRDLRDELAAEPGGPAALIALGAVLDALAAAQQDARDHFAGRFARVRGGGAARAGARHLPEAGDVKTVATYSIKGGVGKTSAAVNLGTLAARDGLRTLIWDLDPQGAASFLFRIKPKVKGGGEGADPRQGRPARRR